MTPQNNLQAWWWAARPKTLTGAFIPVILAGAQALADGVFRLDLWLCCLTFAGLMQIAANLINDLYDFLKGSDRADRLGPERACAQGWITPRDMKWGIAVVLIAACATGLLAVILARRIFPTIGPEYIAVGALCVLFAFLYTTRLSYLGWGDLLVLIFFGLVPVCGTYYIMSEQISANVLLHSLISGLAIDALLVINNFRDRDQDKLSGKRTLVVRFGARAGSIHYLMIGLLADALMPLVVPSPWVLLPMGLYTLMHVLTWRKMVAIGQGRALNAILGETSRNMFVMALLLATAVLLG